MQYIKGGSSQIVNKMTARSGRLWQPDYFDRAIRDDKHFDSCIRYVEWNPVKTGLVTDPKHYVASSANLRFRAMLDCGLKSADPDAD